MLNVYTFHVSLTSKVDKRVRAEVKETVSAPSLGAAWDQAEAKVAKVYPNEIAVLTHGNRQPLPLRPGYKGL